MITNTVIKKTWNGKKHDYFTKILKTCFAVKLSSGLFQEKTWWRGKIHFRGQDLRRKGRKLESSMLLQYSENEFSFRHGRKKKTSIFCRSVFQLEVRNAIATISHRWLRWWLRIKNMPIVQRSVIPYQVCQCSRAENSWVIRRQFHNLHCLAGRWLVPPSKSWMEGTRGRPHGPPSGRYRTGTRRGAGSRGPDRRAGVLLRA